MGTKKDTHHHGATEKEKASTRRMKKSVTKSPGKKPTEKVAKSPKNNGLPKNPENRLKWVPFGRGN